MDIALVDFESPNAPFELVRSLHETGFVVLVNHPIPWSLVASVYDEWHSFFLSDAKFKYAFSTEKQDGYFARPVAGTGPSDGSMVNGRDDKEFFHLFPWGRVPSEVSGDAMRYRTLAMELGARLLTWIDGGTPEPVARRLPMPLAQMIVGGEDQTLLRILHYPPLTPDRAPTAMRAGVHRDTNLLTILACGSAPGLQVRIDKAWRDVPWDPASLVINGGVMLDMLTGGYYPSLAHRVTPPTAAHRAHPRLAMPLFLHPASHVLLDGTQTAAEFLESRRRETYRSACSASSISPT